MSIQPIGFITLVIGFCCIILGPTFAIRSLLALSLLGAAAALFLGAGGQVQPAHLLLAFVVPTVLCHQRALRGALDSLTFPNAGFWLLFATLLGAAGAVLLPRVFAGATDIFTVVETDTGLTFSPTPLMPIGTNLTQTVYLVADLACFATAVGFCALKGGPIALGRGLIGYAALNIACAVLDVSTFYTNTGEVFGLVRNAGYMMHSDEVASGLKRIVGTFPETSSFSAATLGALGYTGMLWIRGRWSGVTGLLSVCSLALLLLSTSSTAIVGSVFVVSLLYASMLRQIGRGQRRSVALAVVAATPLLAVAVVLGLLLDGGAHGALSDYMGTLVFDKATSQSGVERASWNTTALKNLADTYGLGAGLGSVHASSFVVAVAANLGLPGVVLFAAFLWQVLARRDTAQGLEADLSAAARTGGLALVVAATLSGALVDLGLEFYFFAGLAGVGRGRVAIRALSPAKPASALGEPA